MPCDFGDRMVCVGMKAQMSEQWMFGGVVLELRTVVCGLACHSCKESYLRKRFARA